MRLLDQHGRLASYLRLSITDRCNLKCVYCRGDNPHFIPHSDILRYEELLRLAKISYDLGIRKIRVTGGEPFARKDCMEFLESLAYQLPDARLCMTTNATLLEPYIERIAALKPESVNISLDALNPEVFTSISGFPLFDKIKENIESLLAVQTRVKLNAVILGKYTPGQLDGFIELAKRHPVDIRFIEFMPMGKNTIWNAENYLSASALSSMLKEKIELSPVPCSKEEQLYSGPAQMYSFRGGKGRFGFITPMSAHFCGSCNRIRITSNGKLRMCLFDDQEFDLKSRLRDEKITDSEIGAYICKCLEKKPIGADILAARKSNAIAQKHMDGIGG